MITQTRSEFLIEKVAERLGVPKPAEGQAAFSPDPLEFLKALVNLLADPVAAKKRIAEFAEMCSQARDAVETAKKAQADHDAALADIATAQERHQQRLAAERAAHEQELQRRAHDVTAREQNAAGIEAKANKVLEDATAMRADLKRRLDAISKVAAE